MRHSVQKWCRINALDQSSGVSDSLRPHRLQHARLPCPSPTPRVYSNSCPLSQWCHSTISSSVIPLSSCLQSFPASGSFPMSQFFASGGQSIRASASASVLPMNIQDWFPLEWTDWISLQSKGLSRVFSNTTVQKHQFLDTPVPVQSLSRVQLFATPRAAAAFLIVQLSHPYMTPGKAISLTRWPFVGKALDKGANKWMSWVRNLQGKICLLGLPRAPSPSFRVGLLIS